MSDPDAAPPSAPADDPVERLLNGVRAFGDGVVPERREQSIRAQNPSVPFIACADSRAVPETIARREPGALFVRRNTGDIETGAIRLHDAAKGRTAPCEEGRDFQREASA